MKTVTIDLEQLSDAVNKDVLKESKYNALRQDLDGKYNVLINKIPDIATLIANTVLNTKIAEGQKKKKKNQVLADCLLTLLLIQTLEKFKRKCQMLLDKLLIPLLMQKLEKLKIKNSCSC